MSTRVDIYINGGYLVVGKGKHLASLQDHLLFIGVWSKMSGPTNAHHTMSSELAGVSSFLFFLPCTGRKIHHRWMSSQYPRNRTFWIWCFSAFFFSRGILQQHWFPISFFSLIFMTKNDPKTYWNLFGTCFSSPFWMFFPLKKVMWKPSSTNWLQSWDLRPAPGAASEGWGVDGLPGRLLSLLKPWPIHRWFFLEKKMWFPP